MERHLRLLHGTKGAAATPGNTADQGPRVKELLTRKEVEHDARGSSLLVVPPARHLDSGEPPLEDPDHDMQDQAVLREDREMEINTAAVAKALQGDR